MKCFRCKKELQTEDYIYCDTCRIENIVYSFLDMITNDYKYYLKYVGDVGNFQNWVKGPVSTSEYRTKLTEIDILVLNDSLIGE